MKEFVFVFHQSGLLFSQAWRVEILQGEKAAAYPVLEWIFANVDRLKERVYLARYLTRIDVPLEAQNVDTARLVAAVDAQMAAFKVASRSFALKYARPAIF